MAYINPGAAGQTTIHSNSVFIQATYLSLTYLFTYLITYLVIYLLTYLLYLITYLIIYLLT